MKASSMGRVLRAATLVTLLSMVSTPPGGAQDNIVVAKTALRYAKPQSLAAIGDALTVEHRVILDAHEEGTCRIGDLP